MKLLLTAALTLGLAGCASTGVEQYRTEQPTLDIKNYLNGTLDAWGMFQGRSGEVKKRFHVVIDAKWTGDTGVLDENFKWSDGTTSRRVWTLTKQADGSFRGRADDVVGEAIAKCPVMRCAGATYWRCRSMARFTTSISMTGCS